MSDPATYEKEGLQAAVDFVKYILTLAGGGIALIIQPDFYKTSLLIKILTSISFVCLLVCVIAGLLVHARGCVMLANRQYDLEDAHLKVPGLVNQFAFLFGFVFLGAAVAIKAWG